MSGVGQRKERKEGSRLTAPSRVFSGDGWVGGVVGQCRGRAECQPDGGAQRVSTGDDAFLLLPLHQCRVFLSTKTMSSSLTTHESRFKKMSSESSDSEVPIVVRQADTQGQSDSESESESGLSWSCSVVHVIHCNRPIQLQGKWQSQAGRADAEAHTAVPSAERFSDGIGIWIEGKAIKTKTIFILDIFLFVLHPAAAWC